MTQTEMGQVLGVFVAEVEQRYGITVSQYGSYKEGMELYEQHEEFLEKMLSEVKAELPAWLTADSEDEDEEDRG